MKKLLLSVLLLFIVCNCCYAADKCIVLIPKNEKLENIGIFTKSTGSDNCTIFLTTHDNYGARKDYRKENKNNITNLSYQYSNVKSAQFCIKPAVYVHKK